MLHRLPLLALGLALVLVACGGPPPARGSGAAMSTRSADQANIAATAAEPRTLDATAARAPAMAPTPGAQANLGGSGAPQAGANEPAAVEGVPAGKKKDATPPKKIGARHVLIQWMGTERAPQSVVRSREQARALAEEVHKRAKAGEDFARLAVEYSDEPGAGGRGGSLGRFGHGQMVGAFEEAAFKLDVGEISEIVETPFGFHVIQRTE